MFYKRCLNQGKVCLLLAVVFLAGCTVHAKTNYTAEKDIEVNEGVAYTVLLMKVTDEEMYAQYRKKARPIFESIGVLEREFEVQKVNGNIALGDVNKVLVLYYNQAK